MACLRRLLLLLAALSLLAACSAPSSRTGEPTDPVQGYVSAALLDHWCRSESAVDVEACLSYLRGNFDTLAAARPVAGGACIPRKVAVTELRERVRMRTPDAGNDPALPAARMLAQLWSEHYPCPVAGARQPADGM